MNIFNRDASITREELEAFIGPASSKAFYQKTLDNFTENSNKPNWSFVALLLNMYWFMYRKAYLPALTVFTINFCLFSVVPSFLVPPLSLFALISIGYYGMNIYLLTIEKEIRKLRTYRSTLSNEEYLHLLRTKGGVNISYSLAFYLAQIVLYRMYLS